MKTQKQRVLDYLKNHPEGITSLDCSDNLRIVCLHKRIGELIADGERISKYKCKRVRADGRMILFARWILNTEKEMVE